MIEQNEKIQIFEQVKKTLTATTYSTNLKNSCHTNTFN
jgi:hypothetical protein